tara:strand:+ start:772 stop:996 length:225 start_codon:yes stop_codon:yes gene_type:complete
LKICNFLKFSSHNSDILGEENGAQEFDALLEQHADAEEEEPPPSLLDENSEEHRLVARVRYCTRIRNLFIISSA